MGERATPAGEFFRWRPAGVGRRAVPCARCGARTPVRLLESLLEALCGECGRSLALERARAIEKEQGTAQLCERLVRLGALDEADVSAGAASLDALVERGALRRDLRLSVDLDLGGRWYAYGAAPLKELVLPAEVDRALERRREGGGSLPELAAELVRERQAASVRSIGLEVGLEGLQAPGDIDPACRRALPARALDVYRAVPLRREDDALVVAMWDPLDDALVSDLEEIVGCPVHAVLARPEALNDALSALGATRAASEPAPPAEEAEPDLGPLDADDDPFAQVLLEALEEGATEVLLEPRPGGADLRFRVRGELHRAREVAAEVPTTIAERLQLLAPPPGARADESGGSSGGRRRPAAPPIVTGHARWEVSGLPVALDYRVVTTALGPAVAIAFDPEDAAARDAGLGQLGLPFEALAEFEAILARGSGLVVVAGPRRGGKSTAYHAVLERAQRLGGAVLSLERRVRRAVAGTTQLEVDPAARPDALDAVLHPPPDWLGVDGPLEPAARLVADVVLGGGAAVVTVVAPDARAALLRLEMAGFPAAFLSGHVRAVLARRVAPRTCRRCRIARPGPGGSESWIGLGCPACADGGTDGSLVLAELLRMRPSGGLEPLAGSTDLVTRARDLVRGGDVPLAAVADLLPAP